jgi:sulfur-oxidizing protein SoxA
MIHWLSAVVGGSLFAVAALAQSPGRGEDAKRMQADDAANPAFLWIKRGEELWSRRHRADAKACADCHGSAEASMKGVGARHPEFVVALGRPLALDQRIDRCRTERQGLAPLGPDDDDLVALTAYVALQSRGLAVATRSDGPLAPFFEDGRRIYETRFGQFNLACVQCHDRLVGERLGGSIIPPALINGYPIYRLDWQGMGSFYKRLKSCMVGVRAEPFDANSAERVALELFLYARETGLKVETPAVRP